MRCNFCGWESPEGSSVCEKCHEPLSPLPAEEEIHSRPTNRKSSQDSFSPRQTVREGEVNVAPAASCPKCAHPLDDGHCPACGFDAKGSATPPPVSTDGMRRTVRPERRKAKAGFTLVPLNERTGEPEGEGTRFSETAVTLNRDNIAPGNETITSREQAALTLEDGHWYVSDRSELRTTFVSTSHRVELHAGDILLMGDQMFRFELDEN